MKSKIDKNSMLLVGFVLLIAVSGISWYENRVIFEGLVYIPCIAGTSIDIVTGESTAVYKMQIREISSGIMRSIQVPKEVHDAACGDDYLDRGSHIIIKKNIYIFIDKGSGNVTEIEV